MAAAFPIDTEDEGAAGALSFRTLIERDGTAATIRVTRDGVPAGGLDLAAGDLGNFYHEVRYAAFVMSGRQRAGLDMGLTALREILSTAIRPERIDFEVDPGGDTVVVYQFREHAPFAVRLSAEQLREAAEKLRALTRKASN